MTGYLPILIIYLLARHIQRANRVHCPAYQRVSERGLAYQLVYADPRLDANGKSRSVHNKPRSQPCSSNVDPLPAFDDATRKPGRPTSESRPGSDHLSPRIDDRLPCMFVVLWRSGKQRKDNDSTKLNAVCAVHAVRTALSPRHSAWQFHGWILSCWCPSFFVTCGEAPRWGNDPCIGRSGSWQRGRLLRMLHRSV